MREKIQKKLIVTKHAVADMTQGVPEDIGQRNVYLLQVVIVDFVVSFTMFNISHN